MHSSFAMVFEPQKYNYGLIYDRILDKFETQDLSSMLEFVFDPIFRIADSNLMLLKGNILLFN